LTSIPAGCGCAVGSDWRLRGRTGGRFSNHSSRTCSVRPSRALCDSLPVSESDSSDVDVSRSTAIASRIAGMAGRRRFGAIVSRSAAPSTRSSEDPLGRRERGWLGEEHDAVLGVEAD